METQWLDVLNSASVVVVLAYIVFRDRALNELVVKSLLDMIKDKVERGNDS